VTLANPIGNGGAGGLSLIGSGTLNLTAANSFSGTSTLSAGVLTYDVSTTAPDAPLTWKTGAVGTHRYLFCFHTSSAGVPLAMQMSRGRYLYRLSALTTELRAHVFRLHLKELLAQLFALFVQYKKAELEYIWNKTVAKAPPEALHARYLIDVGGTAESWNKKLEAQKVFNLFGQLKGDGRGPSELVADDEGEGLVEGRLVEADSARGEVGHGETVASRAQAEVGAPPEAFFSYFEDRFPRLVLVCWGVALENLVFPSSASASQPARNDSSSAAAAAAAAAALEEPGLAPFFPPEARAWLPT
jgi:autotransporter-associated beta strand protein